MDHDDLPERSAAQALEQMVADGERWRSLGMDSSDGLALLDADGTIRECNWKFAFLTKRPEAPGTMLGLDDTQEDALQGMHLATLLDDKAFAPLLEALERPSSQTREFEGAVTAGGVELQLQLRPTIVQGSVVDGSSLRVRDTTAEEALDKARERLAADALGQEALAQLGHLALQGGSPKATLERAAVLVVNVLGAYGCEVQEFSEGGSEVKLSVVHEGQQERVGSAKDPLQVPLRGTVDSYGVILVKLPSTVAYEEGPARFLDQMANILGAAIARSRADNRLMESQQKAEESSRTKSEFLANMSHEIRTPMNGIIGMSELLQQTQLDSQQEEYTTAIIDCGEALLTLINDILDLSKIEAGKLQIEETEIDVVGTVESAMTVVAHRATEKELELVVDIQADPTQRLRSDPTRLRQVLVNLVGNAIKFTESGEVAVFVKVKEVGLGRGQLDVKVRDTGIGIAEDRKKAIFESFTQADGATTRQFGGTGLGLTISRRIVSLLGGELWVESEVGDGSTFGFSIEADLLEGFAPGESAAEGAISSACVQGRRVFIVDDNATNRHMLVDLIARWGGTSECASSGEEALARLRRNAEDPSREPFDVILLDIQMPGMDGFEVGAALQADAALRSIPVVVLTSLGEIQRGDPRCASFASAVLSKPVRQAALLKATSASLARVGQPHVAVVPAKVAAVGKPRLQGHVLLAEDTPINVRLARKLLERIGCSVTVAVNGQEAVDAVKDGSFDLVLMDVSMPVMNGLDATALIRELEGADADRLPIVAMTAHAMAGDRERCIDAGMDDYLSKPVRSDELDRVLRIWLKGAEDSDADAAAGSFIHQVPLETPPAAAAAEELTGSLPMEVIELLKTAPSLLADLKSTLDRMERVAELSASAERGN